ncbi:MAG: collagen binding domain-containing protein [Jatrophihabitantaceae bacterium]
MTRPPSAGPGRPAAEPPPAASLSPVVRTGAGSPVLFDIDLVNNAAGPRLLTVTVLGLDSSWLPLPDRVGPLPPGGGARIELVLRPPSGTLPASYPFAVAVQATDPATGQPSAATTMVESALLVDEPSQLSMAVHPTDSSAVFGRRIEVELRNTGGSPAEVELRSEVSDGAALRLSRHRLQVPAGGVARIRGRLAVTRPRLIGGRDRHPFLIAARGLGAPSSVTGSLTARPLFSPFGYKLLAVIAVLALWLAVAAIGIGKLAAHQGNQAAPAAAGSTSDNPSPSASGKPSGKSDGGSGGSGGSGGGADASKSGTGSGAAAASGVRLNGLVTATAPAGVTVTLQPTSLVDENAQGAQPVGASAKSLAAELHTDGKISAQLLGYRSQSPVSRRLSTTTQANGSWSFAGISSPGYYLLIFSKPGYQRRKYILSAADADASKPLKVAMTAGAGRLSGTIGGPAGAVGGATITISDGQETLTTSSTSIGTGSIGRWAIDGLSTPGTFLVSASKDGLSLESTLITLGAGAAATVNLTLRAGVASLVGTVDGPDSLGSVQGVGGAGVTVTDGTITRTATTVTSGPVGSYTLPALPVPGSYTVTITGQGYLPQTQRITLAAGQSRAVANATLRPSTGTVQGTVAGADGTGLAGVGMVLTGPAGTYKTMSLSDPLGSFSFNGVTPGTYVLSAELYGRVTSYVTVVAKAGGTPPVALKLATTPGGVLPATSHVRGRVTDARSGGQLSCDQADGYDPTQPGSPANLALCRLDVGVDVSEPDVETACATGVSSNPMVVCDVDPSQEYTVPSIDSQPSTGLLPGLHHLVVIAPGYEPGTVDAQVPLDATAEAAPLALFPAATVVGAINAAVGSLNTGPDLTVPDDPDEPVPAGQDYAHQVDYRTCVIVAPASPAPTGQPGCTVQPPAAPGGSAGCVASVTGAKCSLTSVSDGSYTVRGLAHGTYLVYVHPLNPEYHSLAGVQLILDRGATARYDANLHRLGRLVLSVMAPSSSGGLVNAPGVPVTVSPVPLASQPAIQSGVDGRLRIVGLASGAHVVSASQSVNSGSATVSVGEDQEVNAQLAMTLSISQVIGQVTSSYTGTSHGVPNATVAVSGVVAYSGATPIRAQVSVVTDINGCFAVTADGNAPTPPVSDPNAPPRPCSDVATIPRARLALVIGQADLSVVADNYQPYNATGLAVSTTSLLSTSLIPAPQPISGSLALSPDNPAAHRSDVNLAVNRKAVGTGTIDVSVDDNGVLSWQDSEYPQPDEVRPGSYQLTASLPGYASSTVSFSCDLGLACVVPPIQLQQLGSLSIAAVNASSAPVSNAIFVLSGGNSPPVTQTAPPGSNDVLFTNLVPGTAYSVRIQAAGYAFASTGSSIAVQCPAGGATSIVITAGQQTDCVAFLTARGAIIGTTQAVFGNGISQALANVVLTASYCGATATGLANCPATAATDGSAFGAVSGADGSFRITGSNSRDGLLPGGWVVDMAASGYTAERREYFQVAGADVSRVLSLDANRVDLNVGVASSDSHAAADLISNATLTLTAVDNSQSPITLTAPGTGNLYAFPAIVPTTYSLEISGNGIAPLTVQVTALVGVHTQTVYVRIDVRTNSIAGIVSGQQGTSLATAPLDGVTVSLIKSDGTVLSTATSGSGTPGSGYYGFSSVPDGGYLVRFVRTGYLTSDNPTSVSAGQNLTLSPALDRVMNNVVVNLTASNGFALTGAQAHLTASPTSSNPAQGTQPLTGSGSSLTGTFNSVPSGSWTVWVELPANHTGKVMSGGTAVSQTSPLAVTVSSTAAQSSTVNLTIAEAQLDLSVQATPLALDGNPVPPTVSLQVKQGSTVIYQAASFATTTTGTPTTVSIWVAPGLAYTLTADPGTGYGTGWTVASTSVTPGSSATPVSAVVPLDEQGGSLDITVRSSPGNSPVDGATVSLAPADTAVTAPPDDVSVAGSAGFSNLPPGSYTITATKSTTVGGTTTTKTGTKTVTVTASSTAQAVTITIS